MLLLYSMLIKSKYGLYSFHIYENQNVKPPSCRRLANKRRPRKLRKKKMVGKIGKHAEELHHLQSRLATCEFHLWISYSTDNEHCTNALSLSHTLFRSHSVAVGRLKGLMSRIGVCIAFSARLHCCLHLQQSKLKLCSRF